jgi:hypothetical protein
MYKGERETPAKKRYNGSERKSKIKSEANVLTERERERERQIERESVCVCKTVVREITKVSKSKLL